MTNYYLTILYLQFNVLVYTSDFLLNSNLFYEILESEIHIMRISQLNLDENKFLINHNTHKTGPKFKPKECIKCMKSKYQMVA